MFYVGAYTTNNTKWETQLSEIAIWPYLTAKYTYRENSPVTWCAIKKFTGLTCETTSFIIKYIT